MTCLNAISKFQDGTFFHAVGFFFRLCTRSFNCCVQLVLIHPVVFTVMSARKALTRIVFAYFVVSCRDSFMIRISHWIASLVEAVSVMVVALTTPKFECERANAFHATPLYVKTRRGG